MWNKIVIAVMVVVFCFGMANLVRSETIYSDIRWAQFVENYDGDTIKVTIRWWPKVAGHEIPVRVRGIDTPEIRGECDNEKEMAVVVKDFVYNEMTNARRLRLKQVGRDKYFRILAEVHYDGKNLKDELMKRGYGYEYDGGTKLNPWCEEKVVDSPQ